MFGTKKKFVFDEKKLKKSNPLAAPAAPPMEEPAPVDATPAAVAPVEKVKKSPKVHQRKPRPEGKLPFWRNRKAVGILLMVLSIAISLFANPTISYLSAQDSATAVVATVDIEPGTAIVADMLTEISSNEQALLPVQHQSLSDVVGKYAKSKIVAGEIISTPKLSDQLPFDNAYLYVLPDGMKAMSVTVQQLSASLSAKVEPGDIVSIYVPYTGEDTSKLAELPPELAYVQVLATTNLDGYDITTAPGKSALENPLPATVTLAVNDAQAIRLAESEVKGGVHLALVCRGDEAAAAQYLEVQKAYIKELEQKQISDKEV